ncbi:hypothetical protein JX265_006896 [Neoarthrinium moseri]|uniref:Uncharacterized protein n=1 Tax=Neoarthrinium moseri TaxID=1658444 RepID=A0A9P9WLI2_9PEZI|nr:hypothetical protein JX266_011554 [Neoarthrinium moseri]KAI1868917.1 hypothetical protein JX265_006896 [Neoarthrinium moseri]
MYLMEKSARGRYPDEARGFPGLARVRRTSTVPCEPGRKQAVQYGRVGCLEFWVVKSGAGAGESCMRARRIQMDESLEFGGQPRPERRSDPSEGEVEPAGKEEEGKEGVYDLS